MQKNSITNKITPCCGLPFSVIYWWVSNLTLNSESDRQYLLTQISQRGVLSIDGWKVLINSGTLEADASLTKAEFLAWFDCKKQPKCEQLKLIIEGYKVGNWTPETELPLNLALIDKIVNGQNLNGNVYTKEQTNSVIEAGLVGARDGWTMQTEEVSNTGKVVKKITGYVGGIGTLPTALNDTIGKYFASAGGLTTDINLATNYLSDPAKMPYYEDIASQPITAGTQFIVKSTGTIYRVSDGQTLNVGELPEGSGKVKKIGLNDVGDIIYDATIDGYLKSFSSDSVGLKVKKNGTYEPAWEEYSPLKPVAVDFGQRLRLTGYFTQPWAIIGLDKDFKFVKVFEFDDSAPSQLEEITIDNENVRYITTSSLLVGIPNFKIIKLNTVPKKDNTEPAIFADDLAITEGKFIDENGFEASQANVSFTTFTPESGATYKIFLQNDTGYIVGFGENGKIVEKYGRQNNADSTLYEEVIVVTSDSVKIIKISFNRDFEWKLKIVKTSGGIIAGRNVQDFPSLQSLVESDYKGLAVVGSQQFSKTSNTNFIADFVRQEQKQSIIPLNGKQKKQVLPQLISDDYIFPFVNAYGSGTANDAFLKGSLKDGTLIAHHYGTLQVSVDDGQTWIVLNNADNSKIDMFGRIDNVFICENSDLIIEHVIDGEPNSGVNHYVKRLKYVGGSDVAKWWVNDGLKLTISGTGANEVYISKYWGFDSYKNIILLSEYGLQGTGGATHVYLSTDFGASFTAILDLSNTSQLTAINANLNYPLVQKAYGVASGLHIHGVSYDYFTGRIYVCIGDAGLNGSHILWSDDLGATWKGNLYQMKVAMSYGTDNVIMQALKVIPFENHLVVESDATAQGFFYMERTAKDAIPSISWLYDPTKYGESKLWDEGNGISFKPFMISNNSRFEENYPMLFATAIHNSTDMMAGVRMKVIATWDGINFWNIWEVLGAQINASTSFKTEVYSTKNFIYILSEGRVGKQKYVKLSAIK